MLLNAYFLAQSVSQDPETWRSWCVWGIASSDGLPGDTSAQGGLHRAGSPGIWAPHQPTLCPDPHSSQAAPAQRPNPDSSEASREADLSNWSPDRHLQLPEAAPSQPAPPPQRPLGPPSPLTPVTTSDSSSGSVWLLS